MDVDGEAKAQRKVSPLTFLPVFIFIFIFFLYQVLSFFSLPSFLLVVVIKERRRRKKRGRPSVIFKTGPTIACMYVRPAFIRRRETLFPDVIDVGSVSL